MLLIDEKLVSEDLALTQFVCDLEACKGACCVAGDLGAPLEPDELPILDEIYPAVMPYLPEKGRQAIAEQGKFVIAEDGSATTTLVKGRECAYTVFRDGKALCGIEMAHRDGKVSFLKPISCHLYPIRIKHLNTLQMEALNYDRWDICQPACKLGKELKVPLYKFLKAPLTRKFGEAFYAELEEVMDSYLEVRKNR
jgi:hypothetical protein